MPENIHFHAAKSKARQTTDVNLELWKGTSMLGVWVLTREQATQLESEIVNATGEYESHEDQE